VFLLHGCESADYDEIRRPIQWNFATEYDLESHRD